MAFQGGHENQILVLIPGLCDLSIMSGHGPRALEGWTTRPTAQDPKGSMFL